MFKKFAIEFGAATLLTAIFRWLWWLVSGLASNAMMGWGDDQIAASLGITSPSFLQVVSLLTSWGPPLLLALLTLWIYHRIHNRKRGPITPAGERPPFVRRAEAALQAISRLAGRHPRIMPDHPGYRGPQTNEAADALYMRDYYETIAADVRSILAEAGRAKAWRKSAAC
jgi:hypothetical protein